MYICLATYFYNKIGIVKCEKLKKNLSNNFQYLIQGLISIKETIPTLLKSKSSKPKVIQVIFKQFIFKARKLL